MSENIYEAPQSTIASAGAGELAKIYSPNQVLGGSFWGGPIAVVYFLWKNYVVLGKLEEAKNCLVFGSVFILVVLVGLPFLPESFPNIVIPIAYSIGAKQLAVSSQLDKKQIIESESYTFQSNWKVLGIGTLTLLLFLVVAIFLVFAMEILGIITFA